MKISTQLTLDLTISSLLNTCRVKEPYFVELGLAFWVSSIYLGPSVLPQFELELYASVHKQSSVFRRGKQFVPKVDRISYDHDLKKINKLKVSEFKNELGKVQNIFISKIVLPY